MKEQIELDLISRVRFYYLAYEQIGMEEYLQDEETLIEVCQGLRDVMAKEDILSLSKHLVPHLQEFLMKTRSKYGSNDLITVVNDMIRLTNEWDYLKTEEKILVRQAYIKEIFQRHGSTFKDSWYLTSEPQKLIRVWDYFLFDAALEQGFQEGKVPTPNLECYPRLAGTTYYLLDQGYFSKEDSHLLEEIKESLNQKENLKYSNNKIRSKIKTYQFSS